MSRIHNIKERCQKWLRNLPPWLFTAVVTALVLWLTLAPEPLGEENMPTIPGMDKFAHFMMFGGLAVAICTDLWLEHSLTVSSMLITACIVSLFGAAIELAQDWMGLGRGAEWIDWLADVSGAFFWGWISRLFYR